MEIEEEQMFKNVKDKVLVRLEESIKRTEDYKKWDKFFVAIHRKYRKYYA